MSSTLKLSSSYGIVRREVFLLVQRLGPVRTGAPPFPCAAEDVSGLRVEWVLC